MFFLINFLFAVRFGSASSSVYAVPANFIIRTLHYQPLNKNLTISTSYQEPNTRNLIIASAIREHRRADCVERLARTVFQMLFECPFHRQTEVISLAHLEKSTTAVCEQCASTFKVSSWPTASTSSSKTVRKHFEKRLKRFENSLRWKKVRKHSFQSSSLLNKKSRRALLQTWLGVFRQIF